MSRFWRLAAASFALTGWALSSVDASKVNAADDVSKNQDQVSPPAETTARPETVKQKTGTTPEKASAVQPSAEQVDQWTKDLVDAKFAIRQTASQKLMESGSAGMESVAKAADSQNLELASRCLAILNEGLTLGDASAKKSAREALVLLTKSQNKSVAQRAQQALETPIAPQFGAFPPGIRRGRGAVPGVNNRAAIQVQVNNGVREIKVTENDKEIVLKDNNGKDIRVAITETVNGIKKVTTAEGKDPDDLKKNSPEAHAYYEKYNNGNGNVFRVQIGMNAIPGNVGVQERPPVRRLPRLINPIKASGLFEEIEKLRLKIDEANERLAKAADAEQPNGADLKKISEEIKTATKRLAEIKNESMTP
jgi:hypothetical protein